jgi:hypothetical protein
MSATINSSGKLFIDLTSSISAATYTTYYNWQWFQKITDNIIVGVCVGLIVFCICRISHHVVNRWCRCLIIKQYKKRRNKNAKKKTH